MKESIDTKIDVSTEDAQQRNLPLLRNNFVLMIVSGILIVVGFALMVGSSSGVESFNEDIFSVRRIVIGPMLSFIGFVAMGIAIILKPKQ